MEILAKERELNKTKENKPKNIRKTGYIPAIVFSKKSSQGKEETMPILVKLGDFVTVFAEAGESQLVTLKVGQEGEKNVLISDVQVHPLTMEPIHASFFEVDMKQEITAAIPVEVINADEHPKVKANEGIIITIISEIEVTCLPKDLPHNFEVDALALKEVGDVLTIKQAIKYDSEKVKLSLDPEEVVLKLDFAEQIQAVEEEVADVSAVGVIAEEEAAARQAEGEGDEERRGEKEAQTEPPKE